MLSKAWPAFHKSRRRYRLRRDARRRIARSV